VDREQTNKQAQTIHAHHTEYAAYVNNNFCFSAFSARFISHLIFNLPAVVCPLAEYLLTGAVSPISQRRTKGIGVGGFSGALW